MNAPHPELAISIRKVIHDKLGSKASKVPGFVYRLLEKIIHQDEINAYLVQGREGVDFCSGVPDYFGITIHVKGLENLPREGKYIFASNHPLGGIDGVTLCSIIGQQYDGKVKVLVNDFLMALKGFAPMCVPINKVGDQARNLPTILSEAFESDNQLIIFPAGIVSRKNHGVTRDLEWTKTFVQKSVQYGRDVIPVRFDGENSKGFYRLANITKRLGIKFPLPMVFLPAEMCNAKGKVFTITFGRPIPSSTFDKSKSPLEWAQWVRERVYEL